MLSLCAITVGAYAVGDWIKLLSDHAAQHAAELGFLNHKPTEKGPVTPHDDDDDDEARLLVEVHQTHVGHDLWPVRQVQRRPRQARDDATLRGRLGHHIHTRCTRRIEFA